MRSEALAHDLLQEAFIKIWRYRGNFDLEKGALYTWMLNVTRNHCIDYLRSKKHKNSQQNREMDNHVHALKSHRTFDPQHIGLNELIEKLPEEQRLVIEYAYFQGYTQKEIAEEFDIPLGTVKSRAKAALRKLKKVFN